MLFHRSVLSKIKKNVYVIQKFSSIKPKILDILRNCDNFSNTSIISAKIFYISKKWILVEFILSENYILILFLCLMYFVAVFFSKQSKKHKHSDFFRSYHHLQLLDKGIMKGYTHTKLTAYFSIQVMSWVNSSKSVIRPGKSSQPNLYSIDCNEVFFWQLKKYIFLNEAASYPCIIPYETRIVVITQYSEYEITDDKLNCEVILIWRFVYSLA